MHITKRENKGLRKYIIWIHQNEGSEGNQKSTWKDEILVSMREAMWKTKFRYLKLWKKKTESFYIENISRQTKYSIK